MCYYAKKWDPEFIVNLGDNFYWGGLNVQCGAPMDQVQDWLVSLGFAGLTFRVRVRGSGSVFDVSSMSSTAAGALGSSAETASFRVSCSDSATQCYQVAMRPLSASMSEA